MRCTSAMIVAVPVYTCLVCQIATKRMLIERERKKEGRELLWQTEELEFYGKRVHRCRWSSGLDVTQNHCSILSVGKHSVNILFYYLHALNTKDQFDSALWRVTVSVSTGDLLWIAWMVFASRVMKTIDNQLAKSFSPCPPPLPLASIPPPVLSFVTPPLFSSHLSVLPSLLFTFVYNLSPSNVFSLSLFFHCLLCSSQAMDKNGDGVISASELRATLQRYHLSLKEDQFFHLLSTFDHNLDGRISYEEFIRACFSWSQRA